MKNCLLGMLVLVVACAGCGTTVDTGIPTTGDKNVCNRSFYDEAMRIGLTPPADATAADGELSEGMELNKLWTVGQGDAEVDYNLVVLARTQETTLAQFREAFISALNERGFTIASEEYKTLDNGQQGWYFVSTSPELPDRVKASVLTSLYGRLAYVGASYSANADEQELAAIQSVLASICTDAP